MAGEGGTWLYLYTKILPKPLIPIGEQTITEHIVDRFHEYSCNKFTMMIKYKKHFTKSNFQDGDKTYNVDFVEEEEFLGTGGGKSY